MANKYLLDIKEHLESVNETYWQHLKFAVVHSFQFLLLSLTTLIHGILPCCFVKTMSTRIHKIKTELIYRAYNGESQKY